MLVSWFFYLLKCYVNGTSAEIVVQIVMGSYFISFKSWGMLHTWYCGSGLDLRLGDSKGPKINLLHLVQMVAQFAIVGPLWELGCHLPRTIQPRDTWWQWDAIICRWFYMPPAPLMFHNRPNFQVADNLLDVFGRVLNFKFIVSLFCFFIWLSESLINKQNIIYVS